ncbi:MAG: phosphatidylserine/phosphatidylglycerophosphate/cardiolipin synthase family protein, partial [Candidatus Odinarchaeota archaeon]|nr:phosphatidylserine/phosphatidylglycerophosphate/cardiolipin synthase family protein [Candidatus Odinarchaeota archaeon]
LREYQKFQLLDILEDLFSGATNEILLASPFIDKLIVHFLGKVKPGVRVNILTNEIPRELKSTVIRLKSSYPNIKIKCLKEFSGDVQIYQLHAKFVCIDSKYVIITSANINERSLYYNIEIGIMIEDEKFGTEIRDFFYKLMNVSDEC